MDMKEEGSAAQIEEFAAALKVLILKFGLSFSQVMQALVILDIEAETIRTNARNKK
jgi:hypothetical protein